MAKFEETPEEDEKEQEGHSEIAALDDEEDFSLLAHGFILIDY